MRGNGVDRGVGCLAVAPAAIIGFAGLTDGVGPTGWRGLAEIVGWLIVCLVAVETFKWLIARGDRAGTPMRLLALGAVAGSGALGYALMDWLGLRAPMSAKSAFTSAMQAIGTLGVVSCLLFIAYAVRRDGRC